MPTNESEIERQALDLLEQAFEAASEDRAAFIESSDSAAKIKERALELLASQGSDSNLVQTGGISSAFSDEARPERIGTYKIVDEIGRGGMGSVYLAERDAGDFSHKAAIKVIKPGILSDNLIQRFRNERELLAGLGHRNIARLFDGGETENGSPYIIMEYIEGQSLKDWLSGSRASLDQRLDLFAQVCSAVSYAHRNLIVHRDLTPSNILISKEGEVKLIDFGIAKPQTEAPADGTLSGSSGLSLTPGFAAPERGLKVLGSTLSDVFSLGKILELLTSELGDAELTAISAKACQHDPEERYASVESLIQDLEAYRTGHPVETYAGGQFYRLGKFVKRQKVAVAAAAIVGTSVVGGLVGTGIAYSQTLQAQRETERRFAETRELANIMMFEAYDELSKVPGSTNARLLLAETAQEYLDSLASDQSSDISVRLDAALGYFRLSRVVGGTSGETLGNVSDARVLYTRSVSILEGLNAEYPERQDVSAALGRVLSVVAGERLYVDGDPEAARTDAVKARELLSRIDDLDADSARALGVSYHYEGESYLWQSEFEEGLPILSSGIEAIEAMPDNLRETIELKRALAGIYTVRGQAHASVEGGDIDQSIADLQQAVVLRQENLAQSRSVPEDVRNLTIAQYNLGKSAFQNNKPAIAVEAIGSAYEMALSAMESSPNDFGPKQLFAGVAMLTSQLRAAQGERGEAAALARSALESSRELVTLAGNAGSARMAHAVRLFEAGGTFAEINDRPSACSAASEVVEIMQAYDQEVGLPEVNRQNQLVPAQEFLKGC